MCVSGLNCLSQDVHSRDLILWSDMTPVGTGHMSVFSEGLSSCAGESLRNSPTSHRTLGGGTTTCCSILVQQDNPRTLPKTLLMTMSNLLIVRPQIGIQKPSLARLVQVKVNHLGTQMLVLCEH